MTRVFDTNMLVFKTRVETQEKCKKNASPTRDNVSILHCALGKKASQLRFSRVLLAFFARFSCVFLAFFARFSCVFVHKRKPKV